MTAPGTDLMVVDPRDGTILENLDDAPPGLLTEVAVELKRREQHFRAMRALVETELVDRVQAHSRNTVHIAGYELRVEGGRQRVWDPEDLEECLRELVDDGVLHAGELTGLITHVPKVDGKQAQKLLGMVNGRARGLLERCFRWETKGKPRLTITPSQPLIEGER